MSYGRGKRDKAYARVTADIDAPKTGPLPNCGRASPGTWRRDRPLIDHEIATTRDGVIDELRALGATKEQAEGMYATCEARESVSPRSFWGLAQGATWQSQDTTYQDERYALDQLAAKVLARGAKLVAA